MKTRLLGIVPGAAAPAAAWCKAHEGQARPSDSDYLKRDEFTITLTDFHQRFGAPAARSRPR